MNYPNLFKPIKIGGVMVRNRIFSAPIGHPDSILGKWTDDAIAFYERKAMGGVAVVTHGESSVDCKYGKRFGINLSLDTQQPKRGLAKFADAVRRHGALPSMELLHPGNKSIPNTETVGVGITSPIVYGPSATVINGVQVQEMPEDVIWEIIDKYAISAKNCQNAGFGMVMVHAGHGWLPNQFMCGRTNLREDQWGGSLENRARFTIEIVDAIHKACGKDFPVEVRISSTEVIDGGYTADGEGAAFAQLLEGHADLINCSVGYGEGLPDSYRTMTLTHPCMYREDGVNVKYAGIVKSHMKQTPISAVGALSDPAMMEEIIKSGTADIVEIGRGLICDPELPNKARDGRDDEITHCMRCFYCFSSGINRGAFWCALNPDTNRELSLKKAQTIAVPKKVLIVGGGIGGMRAAITAKENGHDVILCEKSDRLGGHIRCEDKVPFKKHLKEYLDQQEKKITDLGIDVRLNTEVTPEYAKGIGADVLIAALGSRPVKPALPGIDGANVYGAEEVYVNPDLVKENAVILGAGLVGTELALYLKSLGKNATVIEMADKMNPGDNALGVGAIGVQFKENGMEIQFNTKATKIDEGGVYAETKDGEKYFPADTVIYAVGQEALADEAMALYDCAGRFYPLGDCMVPNNIADANKMGETIALDIGRI